MQNSGVHGKPCLALCIHATLPLLSAHFPVCYLGTPNHPTSLFLNSKLPRYSSTLINPNPSLFPPLIKLPSYPKISFPSPNLSSSTTAAIAIAAATTTYQSIDTTGWARKRWHWPAGHGAYCGCPSYGLGRAAP